MALPHFVILQNENPDDHRPWVDSCRNFSGELTFTVVDLTRNDWLHKIWEIPVIDCLLAKPGGLTSQFKQLYDERITILVKELGFNVFPSLDEILVYENKRYLAYWLKAHGVPHPATQVFYHRNEAEEFARMADLPVVAKKNIGASGSGVEILKTKEDLLNYTVKAFETGVTARTGPRLDKGRLVQRAWRKITHPAELKKRLNVYKSIGNDPQKGFVILQEFIPHTFEWRVVRIGDSFFAHKKMVVKEKASGLLIKGYENPPFALLDFVKDLTDKYRLFSQSADIFETPKGYLVNELQCIFGQSDPYQMLVDGKPGRYTWQNGTWQFEEGMFNTNKSYDLRVITALEMFGSGVRK